VYNKVIVGLGNPGSEYEYTRHNIGFITIEKIAEKFNVYFEPSKGDYLFAKRDNIFLIKPLTFMNNSGIAISQFLEIYPDFDISNMLVIHDDMDLPFGYIRIRKDGSSGGHKGVESIIYHIQNKDFCRLRIGIGKDKDAIEWVLSNFTEDEKKKLPEIIDEAISATLVWLEEGIEKAMNRFNKKVKEVI